MIDIQISTWKAPVKFREPPLLKKISKKKKKKINQKQSKFNELELVDKILNHVYQFNTCCFFYTNVVVSHLSRTFILQSKSLCNKENLLLHWKSLKSMTEMKPIFPFQWSFKGWLLFNHLSNNKIICKNFTNIQKILINMSVRTALNVQIFLLSVCFLLFINKRKEPRFIFHSANIV